MRLDAHPYLTVKPIERIGQEVDIDLIQNMKYRLSLRTKINLNGNGLR